MSALLQSIQMGKSLRKTTTVDKSGPQLSGKVLGDSSVPDHIGRGVVDNTPVPEPEVEPTSMSAKSSNRQSVDWFAGMAADNPALSPSSGKMPNFSMATMPEEDEGDVGFGLGGTAPTQAQAIPDINVAEAEDAGPLADIDMGTEFRMRSLYGYEGDGDTYLSKFIDSSCPEKSDETFL
jgi:actin cytoskeleton-regulatory complex protein PAN1